MPVDNAKKTIKSTTRQQRTAGGVGGAGGGGTRAVMSAATNSTTTHASGGGHASQGTCVQQRYEIYDPIASGTYGTIHQCAVTNEYARILADCGAERDALRKLCAVKIQRHDPYFWDNFSFLREIDALMRTRRFPGTVDVLDCVLDTERECAFIVMDQYDGTLLQFINQLPFEERARHLPFVCAQLLITMAYLDRQGIAHRDIKPSNVLVQRAPVHGHQFTGDCARFPFCEDDREEDEKDGKSDDENAARYKDCMQLFAPLLTPFNCDKAKTPPQPRNVCPSAVLSPPPTPRRGNNTTRTLVAANPASGMFLSSRATSERQTTSRASSSVAFAASSTVASSSSVVEKTVPEIVLCDEGGVPTPCFAMEVDDNGDIEDVAQEEQPTTTRDDDAEERGDGSGEEEEDESDECWNISEFGGLLTHSNDGRPRSFPGQRVPMFCADRHKTVDGESSAVIAGDLASLNRTPLVVICDFGLAKQLGPMRDTPCLVTLNFRPPEMFVDTNAANSSAAAAATASLTRRKQSGATNSNTANNTIGSNGNNNNGSSNSSRNNGNNSSNSNSSVGTTRYKTNVDVWSLACVLMQYVTGSLLFHGTNEYYVMRSIAEFVGAVPRLWHMIGWLPSEQVSTHARRMQTVKKTILEQNNNTTFSHFDEFCDMLAQMFDPSGETRPSATDLLTHPFVAPYVQRTMRFMCSITQQRHTYGQKTRAESGPGRVMNGNLRGTARWAFQTGVDVSTDRLDVTLGLSHTQALSTQHRELMCDWLWEQNRTLNYDPGTAIASIHNFDRFMSNASTTTLSTLTQSTYVLACIICFYLTIHYYEKYVADLPTLIGACGFSYEARDVKLMIRTVLTALHFQVSTPSHWTLYCRYRATMHMPLSMDNRVALLLYFLLRRTYFATAIPKAVLLSQVVERIRFNRQFEQSFASVRLRPPISLSKYRKSNVERLLHAMQTRSRSSGNGGGGGGGDGSKSNSSNASNNNNSNNKNSNGGGGGGGGKRK